MPSDAAAALWLADLEFQNKGSLWNNSFSPADAECGRSVLELERRHNLCYIQKRNKRSTQRRISRSEVLWTASFHYLKISTTICIILC